MRRAQALAVLVAIAATGSGCNMGDDGQPYLGTIKRTGKAVDAFYVNNATEPEYLDPGKIAETASGCVGYQLFEGLTKFDPHDNHPVQGVATSWDQSDDNRIFRFHLRADARWSDGKPVTAEDFAYSWRRVLEPAIASRAASNLYSLKNAELYNRGRLLVAKRDVDATIEPVAGGAVAAKVARGTALRVLGRSPLVVASDIPPLAAAPDAKIMSRRKADPKKGKPEQISFGAGRAPVLGDASASWKDQRVDVLAAGPPVDCDGEPDRFYRVRAGDRTGWLPGCLMKPAPGASAFVLVGPHDAWPTYRADAPPAPPPTDVPIGFVPADAAAPDSKLLGVRAVDDRTLEVELEQPTPYFIELTSHLTLYPVRRDVIEAFEKKGTPDLWTRPESMISNGAYVLDSWKFRYEITLKPNPHYRNRDKLKLNKVVILEVEDYKSTLSLYKTGELDYIGDNLSIPPEYMPIAEKKKDFSRNDYLSIYWFELNTKKPPLEDPRVRYALDLAIDKRQIVEKVTRAGQTPATHYVPEFVGLGYSDQVAADKAAGTDPFSGPDHEFDPPRARALLKEAGYDVVDQGGAFLAKGVPNIEILYNTSEGHKAIAVAIQDMWKQNLGISVTLRNEEWGVMQKDYRDGNFQVMRFGQVADYNHPNTFLETFQSGHAQNQTGWANTDFDERLHEAAREADTKKSIQLYREAERIAVEGRARIPLYFYTKSVIIKPYVRGFWGSPFNTHLFEWLWIDPDWERGAANEPAYPPDELPKPGRIAAEAPRE